MSDPWIGRLVRALLIVSLISRNIVPRHYTPESNDKLIHSKSGTKSLYRTEFCDAGHENANACTGSESS